MTDQNTTPDLDRGPVRDGWCCWTCADLAAATLPAYIRPDDTDD